MYLIDKNILFIHIPKTAGNLVTTNLAYNTNNCKYGHFPYKIWVDLYSNINNDTKIFSLIRNPFDKMISLYFYSLKKDRRHVSWFSQDDKIDYDFNKWLRWNYNENLNNIKNRKIINIKTKNVEMISDFNLNFTNQYYLLTDISNNLNKNIEIIYYENFKNDSTILENYFDKNNLKNYNFKRILNNSQHKHYSEYYNEE